MTILGSLEQGQETVQEQDRSSTRAKEERDEAAATNDDVDPSPDKVVSITDESNFLVEWTRGTEDRVDREMRFERASRKMRMFRTERLVRGILKQVIGRIGIETDGREAVVDTKI